jgi:hypothetical protein
MDVVKVWGSVGSVWAYGVGDENNKVGDKSLTIGGEVTLEFCSRLVGGHDPNQ